MIIDLQPDNFEEFYCPVCGKQIIGIDVIERACPHTLFIYASAAGDFVELRDDIEKEAQAYFDDDQEEACIDEYLSTMLCLPENTVIFSITTSGLGCGPVSNTDIIGICFEQECE